MILLTVAALAATLTVAASAGSWWEDCSDTVAVYPTPPQAAAGDLDRNGMVEAADARQTLRLAVGLDTYMLEYGIDADYNGDGNVTAEDARGVLRCAVGLEGSAIPKADDGAYRIRVSSRFDQFETLGALIPLETNADRIGDTWDNKSSLPLWRLCNTADAEAFAAAFLATKIDGFGDIDVPTFLRRYDDAFFADRDLFITYNAEDSGSNIQAVYSPAIMHGEETAAYYPLSDMNDYPAIAKDGTLTFRVGSVSPMIGTADIANWFLFLPLPKTASEGVAAFDSIHGTGGLLPYEEENAARHGKTKWSYALEKRLTDNMEVEMRSGDVLAFALLNAQDGGYLWEYETDATVKETDRLFRDPAEGCDLLLREELVCEPHAAPGAPGLQLYTVGPMKPGTFTLRFSLKRAWETAPVKEYTVTLIVTKGMPDIIYSDAEE